MNKILNNILLQSGLIIPLDTDEIELLARACSNFVKSESFSFSTFESLLIYYIKGKEWPKLKIFIENYISENSERKSTYPTRVNHALVFFCIYLAKLCFAEELDFVCTAPDDDEPIVCGSLVLPCTLVAEDVLAVLLLPDERFADSC